MFRPFRPLRREKERSINSTDGPGLDELRARLGRKTHVHADRTFTGAIADQTEVSRLRLQNRRLHHRQIVHDIGGASPRPKSHDFGYEYPRKKAHRTLSVGFGVHSLLIVSSDLLDSRLRGNDSVTGMTELAGLGNLFAGGFDDIFDRESELLQQVLQGC